MWPFGVPLHFILHKRTCRFYTFFFCFTFFPRHRDVETDWDAMRVGFFQHICNALTKFAPDSFGFVFNCGQCIWCIVHGKICFRTFFTFRSFFCCNKHRLHLIPVMFHKTFFRLFMPFLSFPFSVCSCSPIFTHSFANKMHTNQNS